MPTRDTEKDIQKRWCILIMRPHSQTHTLTVSPFFLLLMVAFGVIFTASGVLAINLYLELYPAHVELKSKYTKSVESFNYIQDMYEYQTEVNDEYFKLLNTSSKQAQSTTVSNPTALSSTKTKVTPAPIKIKKSLQDWSNLFPTPQNSILDVENLKIIGKNFNFRLTNNSPKKTPALGNLLLLFKVETDGETTLVPFPKFDFWAPKPDFTAGPGFNIQYSKAVHGLLEIPPHSQVLEMMVIGQSHDGKVVLKKRLSPSE